MAHQHFTNPNPSHEERLLLGLEVLEGLATGDALGESYSYGYQNVRDRLGVPLENIGLRRYTDDTEMASAVLEVLVRLRGIDEDVLAWQFRRRFKRDSERGYGKMTRRWLEQTLAGEDWRQVTERAFGGGSFGNGSAMRVAPVGAYFFDDYNKTASMATASANVTHAHPEGIAGAVAVAVATAVAVRGRGQDINSVTTELWNQVCLKVSEGRTAAGLQRARALSPEASVQEAAKLLGNGSDITCMDTVPFCVWNASRCLDNFPEAIISTIEIGGDCDTNAAIVGAIVAGYSGRKAVPESWIAGREPLRVEGLQPTKGGLH